MARAKRTARRAAEASDASDTQRKPSSAEPAGAGDAAEQLRAGFAYLAGGEPHAAARELAAAAERLLSTQRFSRARAVVERVQALAAGDAELLRRIGERCLEVGFVDLGVRSLLAAVASFRMHGAREAAEEALSEVEKQLAALDPETLESVAQARVEAGDVPRASALWLRAAEGHRRAARLSRAIECCRKAAAVGPSAPGLHRTWGLALLGLEDPHGALEHLGCWLEEAPEAVDALLWRAEALWSVGRAPEAKTALLRLAAGLGIVDATTFPVPALRARVETHLAMSGEPLAGTRLVPCWEDEAVVGGAPSEDDESDPLLLTAPVSSSPPDRERARVFLIDDTHFYRLRLSQILSDAGIEVQKAPRGDDLVAALRDLDPQPDLLMLAVSASRPEADALLERVREVPKLAQVPVLAITTLDRSNLDLERLRRLGVVGVVDKSSIPEHVVFRVNQIVRPLEASLRRYERAPSFFPVDLDVDGAVTSEYALNLSCGGLRATSSRPLERNTLVHLRFQLPGAGGGWIEARGRVVYCKAHANSYAPHELGIFFFPLVPADRERIDHEVRRILGR